MKRFDPQKGLRADGRVVPPTSWPNGSGVFAAAEGDAPRIELGRIVPEGTVWRAWRRVGDTYVDAGTAENSLMAMMALPDPWALPSKTARTKAAEQRQPLRKEPRSPTKRPGKR